MSSASTENVTGFRKRERGIIAVQACQTCRDRKSRCDEQRPKCGLCQRLDVACDYREPNPTKKDKTMIEILETLVRLENKIDGLTTSASSRHDAEKKATVLQDSADNTVASMSNLLESDKDFTIHPSLEDVAVRPKHKPLTIPHKVLLWPSIYTYLAGSNNSVVSDLENLARKGTHWFIKQEYLKHFETIQAGVGLKSSTSSADSGNQEPAPQVVFQALTLQEMRTYTDAYFSSFNVLVPLLRREFLTDDIFDRMKRDDWPDKDPRTVLALLVFALGQVAIEGVYGRPISSVHNQQSGLRGGSAKWSPGLTIFNEAQRRMGLIWSQCTLESVQSLLLQAMYYETSGRHLDYWRSVTAASMTCQVLIIANSFDWSSPNGDLVKRAYWACAINEDLFHIELDLPETGIDSLEDEVPLPFHAANGGDQVGPKHNFLAMIALRRILKRIDDLIYDSESSDDYNGPPMSLTSEMALQLELWRRSLPTTLQWDDDDKFGLYDNSTSSLPNQRPPHLEGMTEPILDSTGVFDIMTAQLRTRYCYARFWINRPFIYKALHPRHLMTIEDQDRCVMAVKSACLWPLALTPIKNKKRLVPHLFAWTQNFIGILLILRMVMVHEDLRSICENRVSWEEIATTTALLLEWVQDMKQIDGVAEWGWKILEPLYN